MKNSKSNSLNKKIAFGIFATFLTALKLGLKLITKTTLQTQA